MRGKRDSLLMETTKVSAGRTAGEIISALVTIGANEINQSYRDGRIIGIRWSLTIQGQHKLFEMPVRVEGVYRLLQERRMRNLYGNEAEDRAKAERIAWRQLLRWVQAQIAMIQTGMAHSEEVFLPYLYDAARDQTLFAWMTERKFAALPAPEKPQ